MNDNLLIAAVLREVAGAISYWYMSPEMAAAQMLKRAAELDPPEKNEKPE
jgi:hypothetical protein